MTSQPILAICIPTYRRTKEIICNLEMMNFHDPRVVFVISSNCEDQALLDYCNNRQDIFYSQTKVNRGFTENLLKVLSPSISLYSLILSDEDYIDSENLTHLLAYLDCSGPLSLQYLVPTDDYFSLSSMRKLIGKKRLSCLDVLMTNPFIPTYMSGFIFPSGKNLFLTSVFEANFFNYYPHLILRNRLLEAGTELHILSSALITRGMESLSRDTDVNYVDLEMGISRTNYFLSHYKNMKSHNWILEFWVACLVLAQTLPGIHVGYLSLRILQEYDTKYLAIEYRAQANLESKIVCRISKLIVFCSHIFRRIFIN